MPNPPIGTAFMLRLVLTGSCCRNKYRDGGLALCRTLRAMVLFVSVIIIMVCHNSSPCRLAGRFEGNVDHGRCNSRERRLRPKISRFQRAEQADAGTVMALNDEANCSNAICRMTSALLGLFLVLAISSQD